MKNRFLSCLGIYTLGLSLLIGAALPVQATQPDYMAESEARKSLPIQTNEIVNWPDGPAIGAEAAILMDADTGAILYAKNIDEKLYPASTTKILTCLLAEEKCEPDEIVTFSQTAVFSIERGSSNIGMDVGQSITMDQALHGILILSANEVANAVGEHVSGSAEAFVELMNQKATELGCKNSHFMNANGLHDDNHYTTAYDLALIAKAFFSYDSLCDISGSTYCTFEATATQPDSFTLATKNQLVKGKEYEYEYLVGSKTGYTSLSRQTLVSCAKKDGVKLICVILKEESPYQFTDTIDLFNYGFSNFSKVNIAENDTTYQIAGSDFFDTGADVYGSSAPILSVNKSDSLLLPSSLTMQDLTSELTYDAAYDGSVATVTYTYQGHYLGSTHIELANNKDMAVDFEDQVLTEQSDTPVLSSEHVVAETGSEEEESDDTLFVNVKIIIICICVVAGAAILFLIVKSSLRNARSARRRRAIIRKRRKKPSASEFRDYKF